MSDPHPEKKRKRSSNVSKTTGVKKRAPTGKQHNFTEPEIEKIKTLLAYRDSLWLLYYMRVNPVWDVAAIIFHVPLSTKKRHIKSVLQIYRRFDFIRLGDRYESEAETHRVDEEKVIRLAV